MFDYKVWDYWADKYEKLWVQKYSLAPTRRVIVREILASLEGQEHCRILDVGCGTGQLLRDIREEMEARYPECELELMGIDISHRMIEEAQKKSKGQVGSAMIAYACIDVDSFQGEIGSYDCIVCSHSFPYYPKKRETLKKFARLLKPGGQLYLAQASVNTFYDRLIMPLVKLTTSKASYPGVRELNRLLTEDFATVKNVRIKEKFYMPSIYLFAAQKSR